MRTLHLLFAILLSTTGQAQTQPITQITVTISNVSSDEGKVLVGLYNQEYFMKEPVQSATASIEEGTATVVFKEVPKGAYAIIAHHDENNNRRMDFESSGMPKEDYGTSNNPFSMGPPDWKESEFQVSDEPLSLEIRF